MADPARVPGARPPAVGFRRASFQAELHQWHELWRDKKDEEKPKTISEALGKCDKVFFRNGFTILKICATFPVTSCECEACFGV